MGNKSGCYCEAEVTIQLTANERTALSIIRQHGTCAQSRLTTAMGLAQQSISRIVSTLAAKALVTIGQPVAEARRGKPSPSLSLAQHSIYAIGVSIMADSVATGLIDFAGGVLGSRQSPVPGMSVDQVRHCVDAHLGELMAQHGITRAQICGAGVAMTGYFMGEDRTFNPPGPLRHWMGIDIADLFARHLAMPAWVDNDGNAAAIGEASLGVGKHHRNFAYIYFSAGFGGGVIVDGKLLRGRYGNSGEFAGILPYNIYAHPNLELLRRCVNQRGEAVETIHDLVTHFDPTWPGIDDWITKVKDSLSLVASACSAILDTEAIVLGGLIPPELAHRLITETEFYSLPRWGTRRPVPLLLVAQAPGDAVLFGAASIPLAELFF